MILLGDTPPPGLQAQPARDPFGKHRACRGCGCTEDHACAIFTPDGPVGCSWVLLDLDLPTGVCSGCAIKMGWDQQGLQLIGFTAPEGDAGDAEFSFEDFEGARDTRTLVLP